MTAARYWKGRSVLYRFYDADGRLLYVGCTVDLARRTSEHRQMSWWFQMVTKTRLQVFVAEEAARAAEAVAIQEEQPAFNKVGTGRRLGYATWPEDHWTAEDRDLAERWRLRYLERLGVPA